MLCVCVCVCERKKNGRARLQFLVSHQQSYCCKVVGNVRVAMNDDRLC